MDHVIAFLRACLEDEDVQAACEQRIAQSSLADNPVRLTMLTLLELAVEVSEDPEVLADGG